jgi:hypothetical protein
MVFHSIDLCLYPLAVIYRERAAEIRGSTQEVVLLAGEKPVMRVAVRRHRAWCPRAELGRSTSLKAHSMFSATSRRYFSLATAAQISALTRSRCALNCIYALLSRGGRAEPHFWTLMRFDALLRPIRYPVAHLSNSLCG